MKRSDIHLASAVVQSSCRRKVIQRPFLLHILCSFLAFLQLHSWISAFFSRPHLFQFWLNSQLNIQHFFGLSCYRSKGRTGATLFYQSTLWTKAELIKWPEKEGFNASQKLENRSKLWWVWRATFDQILRKRSSESLPESFKKRSRRWLGT